MNQPYVILAKTSSMCMDSSVKYVVKSSPSPAVWKDTADYTLVKNLIHVALVGRNSLMAETT